MFLLGDHNYLTINSFTPQGVYLKDKRDNEVLLPNKYVPKVAAEGDQIRVFVYKDSEDRPVATTLEPFLKIGQFGFLKVVDQGPAGTFLDWGLEKDLLVPFKEQKVEMEEGRSYLVHLYLDQKTQRLVASSKYERFLSKDSSDLEEGQRVKILIAKKTDLGFTCIIENRFEGLIYENEVFEGIEPGTITFGYAHKLREDNKVDVRLQAGGMEQLELGAETIMRVLKKNKGQLSLHDKSSPEEIKRLLGMSKKNFKRSIGILFKKRMIRLQPGRIELIGQ